MNPFWKFIASLVKIGFSAAFAHTVVDLLHDLDFYEPSVIRARAMPGDILEFSRAFYAHFALYLGNGWVMDIYTGSGVSALAQTYATICKRTLEEVCGSSKVRINNLEKEAMEKHNVCSLPVDEIIKLAEKYERRGTVEYSVGGMNCEHYVTKWRYGTGFSVQATNPVLKTKGGKKCLVFVSSMAAMESMKPKSRKRRQDESNNEGTTFKKFKVSEVI